MSNSVSGNDSCDYNTLNGECADTTIVNVFPGGTTTGAIQLRSSTGTFTADDTFYYDDMKQCLNGGTIYELLPGTDLQIQSEVLNIPAWATRITINFPNMQTTNTTAKPHLSIGTQFGYNAASVTGSTWGNAGATNQEYWDNVGVYFYNYTWSSTLILSGQIIIERMPTQSGGIITYTITTIASNSSSVLAYGSGNFQNVDPITKLKIVPGSTSTFANSPLWQIYIE